jgi:hypothetical protein
METREAGEMEQDVLGGPMAAFDGHQAYRRNPSQGNGDFNALEGPVDSPRGIDAELLDGVGVLVGFHGRHPTTKVSIMTGKNKTY